MDSGGLSIRKGHTLLNNLVAAGEVPLALTVYNYMPAQAKQQCAPVDWFGRPNSAWSVLVQVRAPVPKPLILTLGPDDSCAKADESAKGKASTATIICLFMRQPVTDAAFMGLFFFAVRHCARKRDLTKIIVSMGKQCH